MATTAELLEFQCTPQQYQELLKYVPADVATTVCGSYDCQEGQPVLTTCLASYLVSQNLQFQQQLPQVAPADIALGLNVAFLTLSGALVFLMQLGFAMLCAGSIRSKNCMNILLKNILDACVGAIAFYLVGYGFAFGHKPGSPPTHFIGNWDFALISTEKAARAALHNNPGSTAGFATMGWHVWFFQFSFCAAAVTIVSGAVAERCTFGAYLLYSAYLSGFVYPVIVHWLWAQHGWLSPWYKSESTGRGLVGEGAVVDFAGGGVVHMVGGWAALMGASMIGPRIGRFDASGKVNDLKGHSATLVVIGTCLLWFGFYGFNPGSSVIISTRTAAVVVSRVAVITTLGGAASGITILIYRFVSTGVWDTLAVCNGILAGLIAVTSGCSVIEPWAAIVTGIVAAFVFQAAEHFCLHTWCVDDPVSAWAMHGAVGAWAMIAPGLLAEPEYMQDVYGGYAFGNVHETRWYGICYGGNGRLLGMQVLGIIVIIAWSCANMLPFFYILKVTDFLRVSVEEELSGVIDAKTDTDMLRMISARVTRSAFSLAHVARGSNSNSLINSGASRRMLQGNGSRTGVQEGGLAAANASAGCTDNAGEETVQEDDYVGALGPGPMGQRMAVDIPAWAHAAQAADLNELPQTKEHLVGISSRRRGSDEEHGASSAPSLGLGSGAGSGKRTSPQGASIALSLGPGTLHCISPPLEGWRGGASVGRVDRRHID